MVFSAHGGDRIPAMTDAVPLILSVASFLVSLASLMIARSSLAQAGQVAERDRRDWKQRKWFDLYFKASEFYDSLDRFQAQYKSDSPGLWDDPYIRRDFTDLMFLIRKAHSMAAVFPRHQVITDFCNSTAVFRDRNEALSKERLRRFPIPLKACVRWRW